MCILPPLNTGVVNGIEEARPASEAKPIEVPTDGLARIQQLYDAGLCLQAWNVARGFGPLKSWRGTAARVLGGRLALNLGGYSVGNVLHWLAWREDKADPDLLAYHGHSVFQRRGPFAALEFLDRHAARTAGAKPEALVHWLTLRAEMLAHLRDFAESRACLAEAAKLDTDHPWLAFVKAGILELEDRYPEALESARRSVELRPWYRPGVQAVAHALQLLDRDEEALVFLGEASKRIENMHVVRQLFALQMELGLYADSTVSWSRLQELAPLMEKGEQEALRWQKIRLDCFRDDWASALAGARGLDNPYSRELVARLEREEPFRRIKLDVPFVRQHHQTCVPATLSAISRYWGAPTDHLDLAEAICYDGTPAHSERHWAETHGWSVREFTVTWDAAVALLDRGVPFTLTTTQATNAHLQAVVGYENTRQTLWIRDPFVYYATEFPITPLLENQRPTGPRGMALVPCERAALLEELRLPDAALYDQLHGVNRALAQHRRPEALKLCEQMHVEAPTHRLTISAFRALATYDGNIPALLNSLEQLTNLFPNDSTLTLCKLSCLSDLARREERLALMEQICGDPKTDPVLWQHYAQELRVDARQRRTATSWARWALRFRPTDPIMVSTWADLLWDQQDFQKALKAYRIAACLGDKVERFSQSYFLASRYLRGVETGLDFLRQRRARLGGKSSAPAVTLIETLQHLGRTGEALQELETAMNLRPRDSALKLFGADLLGRVGRTAEAGKLLEQARECSAPGMWHRTAAQLAGYANDKPAALRHWREVLKLEPLAQDAIRDIAMLLAETEGRQSALAFLDELCGRFPFSCPLLALRVQWSAENGAEEGVRHVRKLLAANPADAWGWRELALELANLRQFQEALEATDHAISLDPHHSAAYSVRGTVLAQCGRRTEAHANFKKAVQLEVDNEYAVAKFVETGATLAERKAALAEVAGELRRQVIFNFALHAYRTAARGVLNPQEVLGLLREAHEARPDLWQAWSVLINELLEQGQHEEALRLARQATGRFPLLPQLWVDLARAQQARLDQPGEIEALERALQINPGLPFASRQLADCYLRRNDLATARTILEQAIAANPLDLFNHGCLAEVLWKAHEREAAIARVQHALRLSPGYDWGWQALRSWGEEVQKPTLAREMAEDLTRTRAGEARSWLMLADSLSPDTESEQLFAAVDRALALNPGSEQAYDLRAKALAQLNRFEEALAECSPAALSPVPATLKLRAAWIESQRGNLLQAIAKAKAVLEEHPDNYGGWHLLSDWYRQNEQPREAIRAAEMMVSLAPLAPVPLGYLGDLKLLLGERADAMKAFARAFSLDPDYEYAGIQLFECQLEQLKLVEAEATLKVLERRGPNPRSLMCAVKLGLKRRNAEAALESFQAICAAKDTNGWILTQAAAAFDREGRAKELDRLLKKKVRAQEVRPEVAALWVARRTLQGKWGVHKALRFLMSRKEVGRSAVLTYLDQLGRAYQRAKEKLDVTLQVRLRWHFGRILKAHGTWLHADMEGWGKVGYALTTIGRPTQAIRWLQDWKQRPQAESWMLYNLVLMLVTKRRHDESRDVIRHAVNLRHQHDLYEVFRAWAAFEEALLGNADACRQHLARLPAKLGPTAHPVRKMAEVLLYQQGGSCEIPPPIPGKEADAAGARPNSQGGPARELTNAEIRAKLKAGFVGARPDKANIYVREAYRRFMRVAGKNRFLLRVWAWFFYHGVV